MAIRFTCKCGKQFIGIQKSNVGWREPEPLVFRPPATNLRSVPGPDGITFLRRTSVDDDLAGRRTHRPCGEEITVPAHPAPQFRSLPSGPAAAEEAWAASTALSPERGVHELAGLATSWLRNRKLWIFAGSFCAIVAVAVVSDRCAGQSSGNGDTQVERAHGPDAAPSHANVLTISPKTGPVAEIPNQRRFPDKFSAMSTDLVTPHVTWARPLPGGPLKALVVGARWTQRDTVELIQRMDVGCTPVLTQSAEELYCRGGGWGHQQVPTTKKDAVVQDFQEKLQGKYDVIILGQSPVKDFPPEIAEALLTKVKQGAGIVWFNPPRSLKGSPDKLSAALLAVRPAPSAPSLLPADPTEARPQDKADDLLADPMERAWGRLSPVVVGIPLQKIGGFVGQDKKRLCDAISLGEYGRGRVALVRYDDYGGLMTANDPVDLHYEYQMSFVARCVLWAARREGATRWAGFPERLTWRAGRDGDRRLRLAIEHSAAPVTVEVSLAVRTAQELFRMPKLPLDRPGVRQTAAAIQPVHQETIHDRLEAGRKDLSFRLPPLPAGDYFADVQIKGPDGVLNWGTTVLTVQPAWEVSGVACQPEVIDLRRPEARTLDIVVEWTDPAVSVEKPGLHVAVLDMLDGVLAQTQLRPDPGNRRARVSLAIPEPTSSLVRIRAELIAAGQTLDVHTEYRHVVGRPWPDLTMSAWVGVPRQHYVGRQAYRVVASLGVDAVRGRVDTAALGQADLRCTSDITRFNSRVVKNTIVPCYNDPEYRKSVQESLAKAIQAESRIDCFAYMFGDEFQFTGGGLKGTCTCLHCLSGFRQFVAGQYGDIAALNREWGTSYASFDAIVPGVGGTIDWDGAIKQGNYAPLLDQWLFNYASFVGAVRDCRDVLRKGGSRARIGPSTPLWNYYYRAYAWSEIMKHCDFATPYGPAGGDWSSYEAIRSFARPGTVLSAHFGSYVEPILNDEDHFRMLPLMVLFDGGANVFWYTVWGQEGGFSPWIDPYPCLLRTSEEVSRLKDGIARLILGARRNGDGIAIHSSITSHLLSFLANTPKVPFRTNAILAGLWQSGFTSEMISTEQILAGGLNDMKVLILPNSQSIGDAEAAQIEAFVQRGGLLVSDMRPGVADEHGRYRPSPIMSRLFGLQWTYPLATISEPKAGHYAGTYRDVSFAAPGKHVMDPSATILGTAELLKGPEGAPLLTVNRHGQGTAICNAPFSPGGDPLLIGNVLQAIFAAHGIRPWVSIADRQDESKPGAMLPGLKCTRFSDGRACYAGLVRTRQFHSSDACSGQLTVAFPASGHVYDVRGGAYIGRGERVKIQLPPSGCWLLASFPYKVDALAIVPEQAGFTRGTAIRGRVTVRAGGPVTERHVVHVDVIRPDGRSVPRLGRNVDMRDGEGRFEIPLALNEISGTWTLAACDVATGVKATVQALVE